jgi:hypothetical protein
MDLPTESPNILWITTDQQRGDTIQALGNAYIRTPNLDRPCAEGAVSWLNILIRQAARGHDGLSSVLSWPNILVRPEHTV